MRVLSRFLYRAPLLPVGAALQGPLAERALAIGRVVPAARAAYARRAAFRPTPHGLWAGVGVGALGEATRAATGPMRAEVTVAYERLWQLGRERLDPATARLRVAPSLVRDETTARWIAFGAESEAEARAAEVDDVLARVLDGAAGWVAWRALADAAGVDDDFLTLLVDDGLLMHDGAPPLVGPPPLAWMIARHGDPALADEEPKHAVLVHEGEVTLARAAVERAAALAPLLFRLQEALAPPAAERALDAGTRAALAATEEIFGAGAYDLAALALGRYGTPLDADGDGGGDGAQRGARAGAGRGRGARDRGRDRPGAGDGERVGGARPRGARGYRAGAGAAADLRADAGAPWRRRRRQRLAPRAARAGGRQLGAFLARRRRAARRGDGAAGRASRQRRRRLRAGGAARRFVRAPAAARARGGAVDLAGLRGAAAGGAVAGARHGARRAGAAGGRGDRRAGAVVARALDDGAARPGAPGGRPAAVPPAHAVGAAPRRARQSRRYVPRLSLDGFVVAPASWRLPALADADALGRWRQAWRVPAAVQVGQGDELMLVALDDPDALERLRDQPRAYEVWPPLDRGIDAGGRRLEAIVAVIADDAPPPPPLPGVPPPAERADVAAGWHTWKLFGAADRADRVLAGAVAPAVAGALAAAEIDAWFFLRYVDGPGRRDHLRLRVRAPSDAPFAARLDDALAPARAAGDVVTIERAEYQRELGRFGADALDAVERVFQSDSELVLALGAEPAATWTATPTATRSSSSSPATTRSPPAPASTSAPRRALAARRRAAYQPELEGRDEALADFYRARQQSLRARLAAPSPAFAAHSARVAVALAPLPPARRAALLPALLHLAAVRLAGVDAGREAAAVYLWQRTRESLARHREG